jgi:tetratricopeptide (TPR) repeat protein/HEAT repeat protein
MKQALVAAKVALTAMVFAGSLTSSVLLPSAPAVYAADPAQNLERDKRLIETYRSMLADDPTQEYAYRRLLETAHVVGGVSGLVQLYKAEVEKNPKSYAAWLVLGNLQRTADDVAGARAAYDKAAALQPGSGDPHLLVAAMHRDKREFAEAFAAYDKGIALIKDRAAKQEALRAAGEAAVEAKDGPKAEAYFDKMAETEPGNLFLRMQAAGALARLEKPDLALAKWLEIEAKAGGNLQHLIIVWKEIAELQTQLGRFADAEATWRKALERLPSTHYERRTFLDGLVSVHRRDDRLRELIIELAPKAERDVELTLVVARLHEELAEDEEALRYYREAQKRKPSDEEPRMAALGILERIGRPDEVLQAWADLVKAFPREPRHELKLAELYFQHNKPKDAAELLRRISRNYPNDPGVHTQVVDQWLRYGDRAARAEVENEYKILQRLEPNEPAHVMSLGEFYWSNKDTARAESTWARLIKMGKRPGEGHLMLGETYADHDKHDAAQAQFELAIAADASNLRFRRALALLHEKRGQVPQALAEWTRIAESAGADRTNPMTREAREHIIQLWEKSSRLDSEIDELTQKFAATPPDLAAGKFLAVALLRLGRVDEAKAALERLDQLAPEDIETLAGLEQVYTRQSEPKKAIGVLERLAKANPRAAVEYLHRAAELALSMGDAAAALKATKQVVELAPADANAHARVGELYVRMGLRSEAAEAWRQALTLEPRNFPVRFKLASLYRDMGNPGREEQVLGDIVREASDSVDILRAGRRLLQLSLATGRLAEVETLLRPLIEPGRGGRGRGAQLRLVVDVYGHLAQALRFSDEPFEAREKKLRELGERALRPLLEALEDNDVATRSRAIECLELTHPAGATPALARLAGTPESMAQIEAISALGHIGTAGAVAALGRLAQGQLAQTRELALWALGFAPTVEATTIFREHLAKPDTTPRDRAVIAAAIGLGRHPNALQLALVLSTDRSQDVREIALWTLGRLRAPEAISDIAERLARPVSVREAQLAAWGLGQIDTPEARAALIAQLWSGAPMASDDAIWMALAHAPERAARDAMVEAGYSSLPARDRGLLQPMRPAMYLPEAPADAPRADFLRDLVGDGTAADGPIGTRIAAILTGPDATSKLVLADALVRQGKGRDDGLSLVPPQLGDARVVTSSVLERVADRLFAALEVEGDPRVRDAWLEVLAHWQSPKVDRDRVRPMALSVLTASDATTSTAAVRGSLLVLASDTLGPSWAGRGGITRDVLTTALAPYVASPAPEIRAALARALAAVGDGPAQSLLVQLAQDPVPFVRISVALAIADRKLVVEQGLVAELFDLVHDPLPDVSVAAVHALVAQNRPDLVSRLASDPTPHIQRALRDRDSAL